MPRIVKTGATICNIEDENGVAYTYYLKSDTTEIKPGWRPNDHKNPYRKTFAYPQDIVASCAFEAGFDACIEAMEKELK